IEEHVAADGGAPRQQCAARVGGKRGVADDRRAMRVVALAPHGAHCITHERWPGLTAVAARASLRMASGWRRRPRERLAAGVAGAAATGSGGAGGRVRFWFAAREVALDSTRACC